MAEAENLEALRPDVAIVGGGPAGLGAAIALRDRGVDHVMVLEREPEAGGIPRQCGHPPYGVREFGRIMTGPEYARRLRTLALAKGVDVRTRHSVVALQPAGHLLITSPAGQQAVAARRVILATGARETPRSARMISGDRPSGVINTGALQDFIYLKHSRPFLRPVVVGTELVGLSALWTCTRNGIRPVAVIDSAAAPRARWPLCLLPRLLGIPVHYASHIEEIIGSPRVRSVDIVDAQGDQRSIPCDGVLLTGQFLPETALLRMAQFEVDAGTAGPVVDERGRCSDLSYFSAGNLLGPAETAGWCYREGQRVGAFVADDLDDPPAVAFSYIAVAAGTNVAWTMPQRVTAAADASPTIQFASARRVKGRLTVRQHGQVVSERRIAARPQRRLRVSGEGIDRRPGAGPVTISIEADDGMGQR